LKDARIELNEKTATIVYFVAVLILLKQWNHLLSGVIIN